MNKLVTFVVEYLLYLQYNKACFCSAEHLINTHTFSEVPRSKGSLLLSEAMYGYCCLTHKLLAIKKIVSTFTEIYILKAWIKFKLAKRVTHLNGIKGDTELSSKLGSLTYEAINRNCIEPTTSITFLLLYRLYVFWRILDKTNPPTK